VAFHAYILETPVSYVSCLRNFLGKVSSLAPLSSTLSSVSTVCSLSGFCLAMVLLFSAYQPGNVYLSTWNWFSWKLELKCSDIF
jgi:hypothetical protein